MKVEGEHGDSPPAMLTGKYQRPALGFHQGIGPGRHFDLLSFSHVYAAPINIAGQGVFDHFGWSAGLKAAIHREQRVGRWIDQQQAAGRQRFKVGQRAIENVQVKGFVGNLQIAGLVW